MHLPVSILAEINMQITSIKCVTFIGCNLFNTHMCGFKKRENLKPINFSKSNIKPHLQLSIQNTLRKPN